MGKKKAPSPPAPVTKSYAEQLQETLAAQKQVAPELFALSQQYIPKYAELESQVATQIAQADVARARGLLPGYTSLEVDYAKARQEAQQRALEQRGAGFIGAYQAAGGAQNLLAGLRKYAEQQQALGGELSPEEQRMLDQQARAGYAARGTALGGQANLAEIMNRYAARTGRERERQQFAAQTAGFLQQQAAPAMAAFQATPDFAGLLGGSTQQTLAQQQLAGPQYFNPESALSAQISSQNLQALNEYNLAKWQASQKKSKGFGSVIGTGLGAVGGFLVGGPGGAVAGANIGGQIGGVF
jgi:hypothetical protein